MEEQTMSMWMFSTKPKETVCCVREKSLGKGEVILAINWSGGEVETGEEYTHLNQYVLVQTNVGSLVTFLVRW